MLRILCVVLCSLLAPLFATAGTYHVAKEHPSANDANACANSQAAPRRTIAAGQQCLQGPGDTLYVHQGDYRPEFVGYSANQRFPSGTAAQPILLAAWPGDTVTVSSMGADTWPEGTAIAHVIFDGFHVIGGSAGISGYHSNYITFRNCEVAYSGHRNGIEGFSFGTSHHATIHHCHIHHNGTTYLEHGFYFLLADSLIENNDIHHNSGYGIQWYYEPSYGAVGHNTIIRNNRIYENGTATDGEDGQVTLNYSDNVHFYNNLVYKFTTGSLSNGGLGLARTLSNSKIYNNTFYGFRGSALAFLRPGTGNEIRNNIFANNHVDIDRTGDGGAVYSHNLCGASDAATGCTGGDPQFEDAGNANFKLRPGSPARNAGAPLAMVSMSYAGPPDYTSLSRPQAPGGAWDIGAYEYAEGGALLPFTFTLSDPGAQRVAPGASVHFPVTATLTSGTAAALTWSVTGLPAGASASASPSSCTPTCTSTITVTTLLSTPAGAHTLTVTAAGGGEAKSRTVGLTVAADTPTTANPIYLRCPGPSGSSNHFSCTDAEDPAKAKATLTGSDGALACMTLAGKVLYIEGSGCTYTEEWDSGAGGIAGGQGPSYETATRLEGYGTTAPVIQSPAASSGITWFLRSTNDTFLVFKRLVFDAAGHAGNTIAVFQSAHHIRFQDVEVKNTRHGYEPFYLQGASNIELVDVFVHDGGTHALTLDGDISNFLCQRCHLYQAGQAGLNVTSSGAKTNLTLDTLEIRNNGGAGLDLGASTGTAIRNMINHSNGGSGVVIRPGASGTRVYDSTIYSNGGMGLQCESGAVSTQVRNTIMYGNAGGNLHNACGATMSSTRSDAPASILARALEAIQKETR
jgi:Right handed beta helix region